MLLRKRVFRTTWRHWKSGNLIDACGEFETWVRKHFELPNQISLVVVSLHSTLGKNREEGKVRRCPCGCDMTELVIGRTEFMDENLSSILRPLRDRIVYLEVEYE